ncbi:MAG TPA: hypothetical protein VGT98_06990, partial [Candidatus Elarobacter sp.]|nr:hypothetical protein [Candidatus Elarobacter sp.]
VELSNLQRYVLAGMDDIGRAKVDLGAANLGNVTVVKHALSFAEFSATFASVPELVAVAVDNRHDRVAAQASLPRVALNAWTQPGDLGVSSHPRFGHSGGCISCLYVTESPLPNADELIANALGVPERVREIRTLLVTGAPPTLELLGAVAAALEVSFDTVEPYASRPIQLLYSEGICGGAVLPLAAAGRPAQDMHVPLAHQSALAGVLLAARILQQASGTLPEHSMVGRVDVMRPLGRELVQPLAQVEGRRCLCNDPDFVEAYNKRWPSD